MALVGLPTRQHVRGPALPQRLPASSRHSLCVASPRVGGEDPRSRFLGSQARLHTDRAEAERLKRTARRMVDEAPALATRLAADAGAKDHLTDEERERLRSLGYLQ